METEPLIKRPRARAIWSVCDPADTDGDGDIGSCDNPDFDNCTDCVANLGTWIPDEDDSPFMGISNGSGEVVWTIAYTEALNTPSGPPNEGEIVTYGPFTSNVFINLLDPQQTTSQALQITIVKSEFDEF